MPPEGRYAMSEAKKNLKKDKETLLQESGYHVFSKWLNTARLIPLPLTAP
jgi:hypothetical protein